jgi:type II secretory ATPase GspE/PulE/Tfp pilus assembly ATPase PilB-like protein
VRASVVALDDAATLTAIAKKSGFKPMRIQGVKTAMAGETTLDEVLHATQVFD